MCGITGILTRPGQGCAEGNLDAMTDALTHRGPDARGTFKDEVAGIFLGHRRLAIVDLSVTGAQPMISRSRRFVIVLNGEIYNFKELRTELERLNRGDWVGTSDTEVILAAWEEWGRDAVLRRLEGMFSFAIWDRRDSTLTLARDRFGEKPLYVAKTAHGLAFASEMRGIEALPGFQRVEDDDVIDRFLATSFVPDPYTAYKDAVKLPPGCFAVLRPGDERMRPQPYWSAIETALHARADHARSGEDENAVIAGIEERLTTVVRNQMLADVPLGAFLSGGIDSSLIVALMQEQTSRPVRTFTIGFKDEAYDEAPYARRVARHLGTNHTEVMLDWTDALDLVRDLGHLYDEPFADSSQLPTRLVCEVARRDVTVCLSGDAGDEVFGGYNRHLFGLGFSRMRDRIPQGVRQPLGHLLAYLGQPRFERLTKRLLKVAGRGDARLPSEKLGKLGEALEAPDDVSLYVGLVRRDGGLIVSDAIAHDVEEATARLVAEGLHLTEIMMLLDTVNYLPGDILTKVDRAAMSVSLETRAPYLDHELFALAWRLPLGTRINKGRTKDVLRRLLGKRVPKDLFERPKAGFGVPIDAWLKGPLRDWAAEGIRRFSRDTPRHARAAERGWTDLMEGRGHAHHFVWNILMLQAWRDARSRI